MPEEIKECSPSNTSVFPYKKPGHGLSKKKKQKTNYATNVIIK